jgi:hypothetical protein
MKFQKYYALDNLINGDFLVLGGSGWFGTSAINLLLKSGVSTARIKVISRNRRQSQLWIDKNLQTIDFSELERLEVKKDSIILNCTGMNRHLIDSLGPERFTRESNELRLLIKQLILRNPKVSSIHFSSGASQFYDVNSDLYAFHKALDETSYLQSLDFVSSLILIRAWSVTGGYISNPDQYMFSHFIQKGLLDEQVTISNPNTLRKYVSVEQVLLLSLLLTRSSSSKVVNTSGELIDSVSLAELIGCKFEVNQEPILNGNSYFTKDDSIFELFEAYGIVYWDIIRQIEETKYVLKSRL